MYRKCYSDAFNQAVVKKVITETKAMDGSVTVSQIQGMYFVLPCGEILSVAFIGMSSQKHAATFRGWRDFEV